MLAAVSTSKSNEDMIKAIVVDNGIVGLRPCFQSNEKIQYDWALLDGKNQADFSAYDLLIVPNGSDQVALSRMCGAIHTFLEAGKTLFCFDGWFLDWLPGNQWLMDNSKKTIDIRYYIQADPYRFFEGVDLNAFIFSNGISGWWACGYIDAAPGATVILQDTWQRPIMVLDEVTTKGKMFLTASGPLGDSSYATTDDGASMDHLARLYHRVLDRLFPVKVFS